MYSGIKTLLIALLLTGMASAGDVIVQSNTTNEATIPVNILAGDRVITPQNHYHDQWFCLYNDGDTEYMIYMYNYTGNFEMQFINCSHKYNDGFIGSIRSNQMIMLNKNASYRIYASYNTYREFTDVETVKKRFNQWWLIVIVAIMIIVIMIKVYKVIR